MREHLPPELDVEIHDLQFPLYPYMIVDDQDVRISPIQYARFLRWFVAEQWRAMGDVRSVMAGRRADLAHTITTTVAVGAAYAQRERVPHVWQAPETIAVKRFPQRFWLTYMHYSSDVIVGVSRRTARDYGRKAVVVNNGVQVGAVLRAFDLADAVHVREELGISPKALLITCIGSIQPGKGQDVLVRAVRRLQDDGFERSIHVCLVGPTGESGCYAEYAARIREDIDQWNIKTRVHLTGYRADYLAFVKAADVCVHPATLDDSYPAAVRDAMLCGRAVIASSTGGIPEMIEHGVTGLLVPPRNVGALASAIAQLSRSPAERDALASRATVFARGQFDARRMAAEIEAIYHRLVAG